MSILPWRVSISCCADLGTRLCWLLVGRFTLEEAPLPNKPAVKEETLRTLEIEEAGESNAADVLAHLR